MLTIARAAYPAADAMVREPRLEVLEHYVWTGEPHDVLLRRLADLLREVWQVRRLAVDATGLGETMARLLTAALGSQVVISVKFTAESKSRLGYGLLAAVNGGRLGSTPVAARWSTGTAGASWSWRASPTARTGG